MSESSSNRRFSVWVLFKRVVLFLLIGIVLLQAYFWVQIVAFRWIDPHSSAFMRSQALQLLKVEPPKSVHQTWVPYDQISVHAKRAVIAAEDTGFMQHHGIEWEAIERALRVNRQAGEIFQGGSTITMQLAKNLFLSSDRSYLRKAQEVVIAWMLEVTLSKQRILDLYLNLVEFGEGVFGIEAAAQHYYKRPASQLTSRQAAWLASILPAPRRYDKQRQSNWINRKTGIVQKRMNQVQIPDS